MIEVLIGGTIGLLGTLLGAVMSFRVAKTSWHREQASVAIEHALRSAYLFRRDLIDLWNTIRMDLPDVSDEPDSKAAEEVGGEYVLKVAEEARQRVMNSEREIVGSAARLALWTDLYDSDPNVATGFDMVLECADGDMRNGILETESEDALQELLLKYDVLVSIFQHQAQEYLRRGKRRPRSAETEVNFTATPR